MPRGHEHISFGEMGKKILVPFLDVIMIAFF